MSSRAPRRYLTDENVTRRATRAIIASGREAMESRDVVGPQAADRVLGWIAAHEGLVLVTRDRDFRGIIAGVSNRGVQRSARTVWLRVPEAQEAERLRQCLDLIEDLLDHPDARQLDLEYVQLLDDEINVKYRYPREAPHGEPLTLRRSR